MAFGDLAAELVGTIPGLAYPYAQTLIKRAWRDIRDARLWSFLIADGTVICPVGVTTGSVQLTQYTNTVTCNAAASAALSALTPAFILTKSQIRFSSTFQSGQIYNIREVDATAPAAIVLTLDRDVVESSSSASGYIVYRCYVTPPATDFLSWIALDDMVNGWSIQGPRLGFTSATFDLWDPQRQAFNLAYYCGYYQQHPTTNEPMYELWPAPSGGQVFFARYRRRGVDFSSPADVQPTVIPDDLIIQRALGWHAYPWAAANIGSTRAKNVNWGGLISAAKASYSGDPARRIVGLYTTTVKQDENLAQQAVINRGRTSRQSRPSGFYGPIDSAYIQRHPITWLLMLGVLQSIVGL